MNIAAAEARKANESARWVQMKRLPSAKSWVSALTEPSCVKGRSMVRREIIIAEKPKEAPSNQKQTFSPAQATIAPAMAGERMRTA